MPWFPLILLLLGLCVIVVRLTLPRFRTVLFTSCNAAAHTCVVCGDQIRNAACAWPSQSFVGGRAGHAICVFLPARYVRNACSGMAVFMKPPYASLFGVCARAHTGVVIGLAVASILNLAVMLAIDIILNITPPPVMHVSGWALGIALGIVMPTVANVVPIRRALSSVLRDALDMYHQVCPTTTHVVLWSLQCVS